MVHKVYLLLATATYVCIQVCTPEGSRYVELVNIRVDIVHKFYFFSGSFFSAECPFHGPLLFLVYFKLLAAGKAVLIG